MMDPGRSINREREVYLEDDHITTIFSFNILSNLVNIKLNKMGLL